MSVMGAVFGLLFAAGAGMLLGACFTFRKTRRFLGAALETQGVVTANVYEGPGVRFRGDDPDTQTGTYHARVRFSTRDGRSITFQSKSGSVKPDFSVNQRVAILYDPKQPQSAEVKKFGSLWGGSITLAILGALFVAPGIGLLLWP